MKILIIGKIPAIEELFGSQYKNKIMQTTDTKRDAIIKYLDGR